jgi:hypothetical protein
MTTLIVAIASMLVLTALAWLTSKAVRAALCPVCIGVSGTWVGLLVARLAGAAVDPVVLGILLGSTVLGLTQWQAERLPPGRGALLWKTTALAAGFGAAYGIVAERWLFASAAALALALAAALFRTSPEVRGPASEAASRLEERLKRCCG